MAAFQAELASAQLTGSVELSTYWAKHIASNTGNKYYKNA